MKNVRPHCRLKVINYRLIEVISLFILLTCIVSIYNVRKKAKNQESIYTYDVC